MIGKKTIYSYDNSKFINDWLIEARSKSEPYEKIAFLGCYGNDFLNQNLVRIQRTKTEFKEPRGNFITQANLKEICVYFAVRHVIPATWLNDRDQFLYPKKKWKTDLEFQNDCLAYTLFHGQNRVSSLKGTNHWIPFTEAEVGARDKFESKFMSQFIKGTLKHTGNGTLLETEKPRTTPLEFSEEAKAVFEAGKALWRYYHQKINEPNFWGMREKANSNASLYDIREYFQGRNEKGKMNNKSEDETYQELLGVLRSTLDSLAKKIEPKVYEYEFLKE